jgi:hypothetical protein
MSHFAARPLNTNKAVEDFLQYTLDFKDFVNYDGLVEGIVNSELGVVHLANNAPTLSSPDNRNFRYRDDIRRWELREAIIDELVSIERLENDDDIKLGVGGALPKKVQKGKQAFILIGPPASGKSGVAESIADDYGAVIIDSDYAKRKLPEYDKTTYGASLVNDESSEITFGFGAVSIPRNIQPVIERCLIENYNLVIPRIGSNYAGVLSFAQSLKNENDYKVHLILVALSKKKATIRAAKRFYQTERYVPLSLIFDIWGNDSWLTYFYLKSKHGDVFQSFGALSTDVPMGEEKIAFDIKGRSPVSKFRFEDLEVEW